MHKNQLAMWLHIYHLYEFMISKFKIRTAVNNWQAVPASNWQIALVLCCLLLGLGFAYEKRITFQRPVKSSLHQENKMGEILVT